MRNHGSFVPLPAIPEALLERGFRRAVLDFLAGEGAISDALRSRMLGWRYSGFSVHDWLCVRRKWNILQFGKSGVAERVAVDHAWRYIAAESGRFARSCTDAASHNGARVSPPASSS